MSMQNRYLLFFTFTTLLQAIHELVAHGFAHIVELSPAPE